MAQTLEAIAVMAILAGFLLFSSFETLPMGALLVVGGGYALILPQFIDPRPTERPEQHGLRRG
jgi:hypothetical protein